MVYEENIKVGILSMKKIAVLVVLLAVWCSSAFSQFDPFDVHVELDAAQIRLNASIPTNHYLYADHLVVTDALGTPQRAIDLPDPAMITDPNSGEPKPVYSKSFSGLFAWEPKSGGEAAVHVQYWGCNDEVCFIPQSMVLELEQSVVPEVDADVSEKLEDWQAELEYFEITATDYGFKDSESFLAFLDGVDHQGEDASGGFRYFLTDPVAFVRESGLLVAIIFILIGGLALNLTPCVLPMIPINLAIIGAGAQAGSRGRGFALGATYGLGIAMVYGLLGVAVVLTGSQFGTIQANAWFNLVIALIFSVLALAMFDIIQIDFSRFQSKMGGSSTKKQGSFIVALTMGSVAALLAGACVAPVVIAVLLLATNVYEANQVAGLALPFVLGLGMALPWPFAGAGLSFLPKPGKWMEWVKYGFGVGIIFFALYYGHLSYRAFRTPEIAEANKHLAEKLKQARLDEKPVFIDFTASWCKNCKAMEKTTFRDEAVKARLENFQFIKYAAENFEDPETKAVLRHFGVQGLPTFVVLKAK